MSEVLKAILLIDSSKSYGRELLCGITRYSRQQGLQAFYRESVSVKNGISDMKKCGANGIIAATNSIEEAREIVSINLPIVADLNLPKNQKHGLYEILSDNVSIGKMAAEYLLNCGFKHFAYCTFGNTSWYCERGEHFSEKISCAGFDTHFNVVTRPKNQGFRADEQAVLIDWLKSLPKPVGLMACDDNCGQRVIETCNLAGLHVPRDVAVLGVGDDKLICELTSPPLSTIKLNTERIGYKAAELLDKLMTGAKVANRSIIISPVCIVTRQSTNILTREDARLTKAMYFIQQHSKKLICVDDVAKAASLSRRNLERRFCKVFGRSIYKEIRRTRVNRIAEMLVKTDMSIVEIASALGYYSTNHIARYFRKEKGMSPRCYRKQYSVN